MQTPLISFIVAIQNFGMYFDFFKPLIQFYTMQLRDDIRYVCYRYFVPVEYMEKLEKLSKKISLKTSQGFNDTAKRIKKKQHRILSGMDKWWKFCYLLYSN